MEHMKEVTRYQCQYCKKDFKTPNRHNCKRDPAKKNCYTCKNNKSWKVDEGYTGVDNSDYYRLVYPDCEYAVEIEKDIGAVLLQYMYENKYNLQCKRYVQK